MGKHEQISELYRERERGQIGYPCAWYSSEADLSADIATRGIRCETFHLPVQCNYYRLLRPHMVLCEVETLAIAQWNLEETDTMMQRLSNGQVNPRTRTVEWYATPQFLLEAVIEA
jgi:hypothetical protein